MHEDLRAEGVNVIRIGPDDDWESVVRAKPSVFGTLQSTGTL
jgi:hypothetical protein